jgi:gliding motility-associated-like protein
MQTWQVRLKAESHFGCQRTSSWEEITVLPVIKPGFTTTQYNPFDENCTPLMVHFRIDDATISKMPENFTWRISDTGGTLSTEETSGDHQEYAYVFEALGNSIHRYQVNLSANIPNACTLDSSLVIAVNPNAAIYVRMDTILAGCDEFVFDIEAFPKGLSSYLWELNENGNIHTLKDSKDQFRHTVQRNTAGNTINEFSVTLETSNFAGCLSSTTVGVINIPSQTDFTAEFTADPLEQFIPNRRVNIRPDQFVPSLRYHWDFGDGNYSVSGLPGSHTYETDGTFDIRLKVSEDHCEKESVQRVVIQPVPPQVDFSFTPGSGCVPLTIQFTNLSQYADASTYRWNFGRNQGISSAANPSYTYHEPGIYTVRLEATNATGQVVFEEKEAIIEVFANPFASFNVRPLTVKLPNDPVYTTNQSRGATDYIWDFGDGSIYQVYEPVHHYQDTGRYDITLIAISSEGCKDTLHIPQAVHAAMGNLVRIPNAFIPSLDGPGGGYIRGGEMNAVFYPISEGVVARRMQIYNRWGELLFETDDMGLGWDGYYKGKLCPQDVYVYKVYFKYMDGKEENRVGDVTLLR